MVKTRVFIKFVVTATSAVCLRNAAADVRLPESNVLHHCSNTRFYITYCSIALKSTKMWNINFKNENTENFLKFEWFLYREVRVITKKCF